MILSLVSAGWSPADWWEAAHRLWALRPRGCQEHLRIAAKTCIGLTPFGSEVEYVELLLLLLLITTAFLLGRVTACVEINQVIAWFRPPPVIYVGHGSRSRFGEESGAGGSSPSGVRRRTRVAREAGDRSRDGDGLHDGDARRGPLFDGPECN